jgi:6-phosphogluconolactonase (cycloisomerase 2 family)
MAAYMNGDFVYTAASGSNQVAGFSFNSVTGALTPIPGSPFPPPADVSHPQSITFDRSGNFGYTANDPTTPGPPFGFGNVSAYRVDFSTGLLTFVGNVDAGTAAGGPVMVAVDPFTAASSSGPSKFAYVAGGDVFAFNIVAGTGELSAITGSPFPAGINPKWVAVDPSGKFVYVANHGASSGPVVPDGSVSAYQIGTDGALTPITGLSPLPRGPSSITVIAVP